MNEELEFLRWFFLNSVRVGGRVELAKYFFREETKKELPRGYEQK